MTHVHARLVIYQLPIALEFAENFSTVSASQVSPRIHVEVFRDEPDGSVTQQQLNSTDVLTISGRCNPSRRVHT